MSIELLAELRVDPDDQGIPSGWRGLVDFGEQWTDADASLWPSDDVPVGKPLMYGCEAQRTTTESGRECFKLTLWSLDSPRPAMVTGARLSLRDGLRLRAEGQLS